MSCALRNRCVDLDYDSNFDYDSNIDYDFDYDSNFDYDFDCRVGRVQTRMLIYIKGTLSVGRRTKMIRRGMSTEMP
eukprot:SAG22_NODE_13575_length_402_cov_0.448845_1_plen_75_part_10